MNLHTVRNIVSQLTFFCINYSGVPKSRRNHTHLWCRYAHHLHCRPDNHFLSNIIIIIMVIMHNVIACICSLLPELVILSTKFTHAESVSFAHEKRWGFSLWEAPTRISIALKYNPIFPGTPYLHNGIQQWNRMHWSLWPTFLGRCLSEGRCG